MTDTVDVMFVCLGNICRSPTAEALLRHEAEERGLGDRITAASCGTGDWHVGEPPHEGTRRVLEEHGISHEGMRSETLDAGAVKEADYIIAMDSSNAEDMRQGGIPADRIHMFTDFVPGKEGTDVPDPYHTGGFDQVYELVEEGVEGLLRHMAQEQGW